MGLDKKEVKGPKIPLFGQVEDLLKLMDPSRGDRIMTIEEFAAFQKEGSNKVKDPVNTDRTTMDVNKLFGPNKSMGPLPKKLTRRRRNGMTAKRFQFKKNKFHSKALSEASQKQ